MTTKPDPAIKQRWDGPDLARVTTPAEAIALAVDRIPADLGQNTD